MAEGQIQALKRSIVHSRLTCKELESLPPATPLYHAVGRMFLLASHEGVRASLASKALQREAEEKIKEIEVCEHGCILADELADLYTGICLLEGNCFARRFAGTCSGPLYIVYII